MNKKFKIVEISGDSCASCHAMARQAYAVAQSMGMDFERIDIESSPEAVSKFKVERIPTVAICDGETIIAKCSGYQPEEILSLWAEAKTEEYMRGKV